MSTEVQKLFNRINHKFSWFNYQREFTLPPELCPWYVVITEMRLFFLSPLVIFVNKKDINQKKHNILEEELEIINFEKLLGNYPNKFCVKEFNWLGHPQNTNLTKIRKVAVFSLQNWYVLIFLTEDCRLQIKELGNEILTGLRNLENQNILVLNSWTSYENQKRFKKDLFPITDYKKYFRKRFKDLEPFSFLSKMEKDFSLGILLLFFDEIYRTIYDKLKMKYEDLQFDLLFNALDSEFLQTFVIPLDWWNRKRRDSNLFFELIERGTYLGEKKGLAEYVNKTGLPEFITALEVRNESNVWSDKRMVFKKEFVRLLGLDDTKPIQIFQVPCVYTLLADNDFKKIVKAVVGILKDNNLDRKNEKYKNKLIEDVLKIYDSTTPKNFIEILEKIEKENLLKETIPFITEIISICKKIEDEKYCLKVVYNFSFHSQIPIENLYDFWCDCFDLTFDCLFAAGFVQSQQSGMFKSSVFEEATDSFKMAMKYS